MSLTRFFKPAAGILGLAIAIGVQVLPTEAFAHSDRGDAKPNLALLSALVREGGGPSHFSARTLRLRLGGPTETAKLDASMGQAAVTRFDRVFTFAVLDGIATMRQRGIVLPAPNPVGSKAVAVALFRAGLDHGMFNVERLFDTLFSQDAHMHAMMTVGQRYGAAGEAAYHQVFGRLIADVGGNGASVHGADGDMDMKHMKMPGMEGAATR